MAKSENAIMNSRYYTAPCAVIRVDFNHDHSLKALHWAAAVPPAAAVLDGAWADKLDAYFSGSLKDFHHPPSPCGTAFQQKVWQMIAQIPYGRVASYGEIARLIGSAPRAVGQACGKNPLPLIVPCHRVVSHNGLGGFSFGDEHSLAIKRWLLHHEGAQW